MKIKGTEIIKLWNEAKEMVQNIPNEMYADDYINRTSKFKTTNSIYGICYFKPRNYNITFRITNYRKENWSMTEYVGLLWNATQIRYIKPNEDYYVELTI